MADPITEQQLKTALSERLEASHVDIVDTSGGCGQSFAALVVSPQFRGLNSLKRHRAVNAALRDEIARIHAWSARCKTPEEWEAERPEEDKGVDKEAQVVESTKEETKEEGKSEDVKE